MSGVHARGVRRFHFARDVEEALSLLAAYEGRGALLAGGVDLLRSLRVDIEGLIDITRIGLSYTKEARGGLAIGGTTTLTSILESRAAREYGGGILADLLHRVAVPPLRNMATLGGALVSAHPWADIPTALVALGAEVRWQGEKEGRVPVEELYQGPFRGLFRQAVAIEVLLPPWDGAFAYEKVGRTGYDIALLNACCGVGVEGGRIAWARVAVGARPDRGERLPWAEEALIGQRPSQTLWQEVQDLVAKRIEVGDDRRASGAWRREVAGVLVERALARASGRAGM
ncbi:FAD binding domain-containing protein [Candidatus Bipolaricaulota bacterium]|nr:FAD binding domain-containing protein [Candidatus Bipolaricaulota bacterium]